MKKKTVLYKGNEDAFGAAVNDFYRKKDAALIIERDDGYVDIDTADHYFHEFRQWPEIEREGIKFVKGNVLDVGAGAGRVSLYLQKSGFKATALDNSPLALDVCTGRGVRTTVLSDIEHFSPSRPFDTILMYGNNFGLMQNHTTAIRILEKMYDYTSDNAVIIAETMNVYTTTNESHLQYQKKNRLHGKISGQIRFRMRYQNHASPYFDYLFVNEREMRNIILATRWELGGFIKDVSDVYIALLMKRL
jgi:2-polyprenyl-3-methyl-5-hydroxy-6-metoxy-1,4-benzoquinol methylase